MAREFLFSNFGQTVLQAPLGQLETVFLIEPSSAERFPTPATPDQVFAVILTDGKQEPEIIWVTHNPKTGVLTGLRGQEQTPAGSWGTGTSVIHTHTKDSLEWFVTGGQIIWKNEFQALLDALAARLAAVEAKNQDQDENDGYIRTDMEALFEQSGARITEYQSVVADEFFAQSTRTTTLEAWQGPFNANVTEFMQATATTQFAQAQRIDSVEVNVGQANAKAQQALNAYADTQQSYASLEQTVSSNFGSNSARMDGIDYTMANNYEALAQSINTVSVNLGGLNSRVDVVQEATGGPEGMKGMFAVRINANGSLAYFDLVAGTSPLGEQYSNLKLGVNQFIIDTPGGSVNPLIYDAVSGWLEVQNLRVRGQLIVNGTVNGQEKAIKDTFTYGTTIEVNPNVVFGPGPDSPGGGSWTDIWSGNFNANGGRVKLSFQCVLGNADTVKTLDARVNILVDGVLVRYFAAKLGTDYGSTVAFSASVYVTPGVHSVAVQAGTKFATNGGTANGTFMSIILDIDDYNTES